MCNAPNFIPQIVCEYDRNPSELAWTEGLQWYNGYLYESTGSPPGSSGKGSSAPGMSIDSSLQQLKLEDGKVTVEKRLSLPFEYFGEGMARVGSELYQLAQDSPAVLVYKLEPLTQLPALPHATQKVPSRWGLCYDRNKDLFYLSDGSYKLKLYPRKQLTSADPNGSLEVRCGNQKISNLNTLEFANGFIYAAVRTGEDSNRIVQIDPASGSVVAQIDATNLRERQQNPSAKDLNGIAFYRTDHADKPDTFFVTGKFWSKIFEVKFVPKLS